jgi:hypothetical protein
MNLEYLRFKDVDLNDVFFDSLKNDYAEFSTWFKKKPMTKHMCLRMKTVLLMDFFT